MVDMYYYVMYFSLISLNLYSFKLDRKQLQLEIIWYFSSF
jgi:hypothetical protein